MCFEKHFPFVYLQHVHGNYQTAHGREECERLKDQQTSQARDDNSLFRALQHFMQLIGNVKILFPENGPDGSGGYVEASQNGRHKLTIITWAPFDWLQQHQQPEVPGLIFTTLSEKQIILFGTRDYETVNPRSTFAAQTF